jgi:hypothetical protein
MRKKLKKLLKHLIEVYLYKISVGFVNYKLLFNSRNLPYSNQNVREHYLLQLRMFGPIQLPFFLSGCGSLGLNRSIYSSFGCCSGIG